MMDLQYCSIIIWMHSQLNHGWESDKNVVFVSSRTKKHVGTTKSLMVIGTSSEAPEIFFRRTVRNHDRAIVPFHAAFLA